MEVKKQIIDVIQLSNYVRPDIKEVNNKEYVMNGDKNSFYTYIIERYNGSPTNRAIIDSYAKLIYGKGLFSKQQASKPLQFAQVLQKLSKKDLRNICQDYAVFSEAAYEAIYEGGNLVKIKHVPKNQVLPNKMTPDGDIEGYWFSLDFNQPKKYEPIFISKWEAGKKNGSYIKIISSYQLGKSYFTDPVYMAGLPYAQLEEEIANFCINYISNDLSIGKIINMNSGEPQSEEVRANVKKAFKKEGQGTTNAGNVFINWNDNKDTSITIDNLEVNDAYQQFDWLSKEAQGKILTSHKVVSGKMFGIDNASGFSSNADEIETAFNETMLNVIKPMQEVILDDLMETFSDAGFAIDLDFVPLRKEDVAKNDQSYNGAQISSAVEIITNVKAGILSKEQAIVFLIQFLNIPPQVAQSMFSTEAPNITQLSSHEQHQDPLVADALLELGEVITDDWELVDEIEVVGEPQLSEISLNLASVPSSFPNVSSEQDTSLFKIRYKYAGNQNPEREFCAKMMKADKVYRKEDIEIAETKVVNAGLGLKGADKYSIWLYKGGVNCKHFWQRQIYLRKNNGKISVNQARKMILELDPKDRPLAKWQENDPLVAQPAQASNNYFKAEE